MRLSQFLTAQPVEPPRLKLLQVVEGFKVYEVDGEWIRGHLQPDFTSFGHHLRWHFIPEGEFWIDHEEVQDDWPFYIKRMLAEHALMKIGFPYEEARELGERVEAKERSRHLKVNPADISRVKIQQLGVVGDLTVWLVDGKVVRDQMFTNFKEGGNDLAYPWMPKKEIWIDNDLKPSERKLTILHELAERRFMSQGWTYLAAHIQALEREVANRRLPGTKLEILPLPFTRQSTSFSCGAAALQSVLSFYRMFIPEDKLIGQLRTTEEGGTSPAQIAEVAQQYGLRPRIMKGMQYADLQRLVDWGIPVIVAYQAWQEGDPQPWEETWEDGHYSAVMGIDEDHIYLDDPSIFGAIGSIPLEEFDKRWHDMEADGQKHYRLGISCYKPGENRSSVVTEEKVMKVSEYLRQAETDIVVSPNSIMTNIHGRLDVMNATDIESTPGAKMGDPARISGAYNDKKFKVDISVTSGEATIRIEYNGSQVSKTFSPLEIAKIPFWVSAVLV